MRQGIRKVGTDQDDVVHGDAADDNHQEAGVHQAQVVDDDVEGNHAALEVHGEDEQLHDDAVARKVLPGGGRKPATTVQKVPMTVPPTVYRMVLA